MNNPPRDASSERASLADLSTQTQTLLSQLNAQTSRLSNTLTQLTDEILRSGSRLAYEVEILRGETVGLSDALNEGLKDDVQRFVPEEVDQLKADNTTTQEPEYIARLRTLTLVRLRLDSVIKIFGEAMQWPLAPSELSVASSLISVSAPDVGPEESRSREEKGKEYAQKLRDEIAVLIESGSTPEEGIDAANKRIDELRELAAVWKGSAEEKARTRFVESLTKTVEDRQRALTKRSASQRRGVSASRGVDYRYGPSTESQRSVTEGGYGFIKNLQRIKGDIYLE